MKKVLVWLAPFSSWVTAKMKWFFRYPFRLKYHNTSVCKYWMTIRQTDYMPAKNRYYNANRTRHAFTHSSAIKRGLQLSWPQQKKVHLFLLISEDKILLSAAFRDESQVYAFKMGDLLHSAIEFMIDHWIALAIGLLVLLIHRYVCTMQQNVSSKIIHETPRWVKKTQIVLSVVWAHNPIPCGYLASYSWVWVGVEFEVGWS